jgi:hypothetical protein
MLFRGNVGQLMQKLDPSKAVYVVKHNYKPTNEIKMDGQLQSNYRPKTMVIVLYLQLRSPGQQGADVGISEQHAGSRSSRAVLVEG